MKQDGYPKALFVPEAASRLPQVVLAKQHPRPLVVMIWDKVRRVLPEMGDGRLLMAKLRCGCGLRDKDLDFEGRKIYIRAGKGNKGRVPVFLCALTEGLHAWVDMVRTLHDRDVSEGFGEVCLPGVFAGEYPGAARAFPWLDVFP